MYIGLFLDHALICLLKKTKLSKSNTLTKHYSDLSEINAGKYKIMTFDQKSGASEPAVPCS